MKLPKSLTMKSKNAVAIAALFVSVVSNADTPVACGPLVSCTVGHTADECKMLGGTPSYFASSHPNKPQGDTAYVLSTVSVSAIGTNRFAGCWYTNGETTFEFKSITSHSIVPVHNGDSDEWIGDTAAYKTCDPTHYPCTLNARY